MPPWCLLRSEPADSDSAELVRQQLLHLLVLVVEVFNHRRSATQLRGMVTARLLSALVTRTHCALGRYRLHSVHGCQCAEGAVEFCATVWVTSHGETARAMAMAGRLERHRKGWIATELSPLDHRCW